VITAAHTIHNGMHHHDSILIRDALPTDFAQILTLNEESVQVLSPLSPERLAHLHRQAAYHRVLVDRDRVAAFLLAFREAAQYDSPNYRWFNDHFPTFLYIDRIVVAHADRGHGFGRRLYADLFAFAARTHAGLVTCEFDIDPPNEPSRRFHQRYGFKEVGTQWLGANSKQVSLQAVSLPPTASTEE